MIVKLCHCDLPEKIYQTIPHNPTPPPNAKFGVKYPFNKKVGVKYLFNKKVGVKYPFNKKSRSKYLSCKKVIWGPGGDNISWCRDCLSTWLMAYSFMCALPYIPPSDLLYNL